MSSQISRRDFVKATVTTTGAAALSSLAAARVQGANDRIQMGVIGVGGMGTGHVGGLVKRAGPITSRSSRSATSTSGG